ncbi:MAG TPA: 23S rRNA (pseudouridine(1915)-N(3))-methyltransferase RlmH [Acholeplasmataceae bacterium]|jgi:23S rRNA (pseudouridine1915-N3)-methyltransferase|nr:23S rRNA (pseudouridine(1915)-N(3))-methyltransferase RlmH [Acholeplasmataceae bacterium]
MEIKIIAVGKIKEKYIEEGIKEYLKRIVPFCKFNIIETKEFNFKEINKNIHQEGLKILENISDNDLVITLEIEGKLLNSLELSEKIKTHFIYQNRALCFVIGGSNGLSKEVKARSNLSLSFGKFTYPHQLMRLILCEQIYRSLAIINNIKYHK